ncbi:MAG TPA: hypothetical protein VKB38_21545 [Terracidiphilus sp.]|nr:hypothetical protein [Terracidiphilus sp.]
MPSLEDFRSRAAVHNGKMVVWINQSNSPTLKSVNSQGVCKAITMDWIVSYRGYLEDRATFVNGFRQYDESGTRVGYSIPQFYLDRQEQFTRELAAYNLRFKAMVKKVKAYTEEFPNEKDFTPALLETLKIFIRVARAGIECIRYTEPADVDAMVSTLSNLKKPGYYTLALTKPGGHVLGFEFRPDQKAGSFPGIFEFIDANSGLFVFGKAADMLAFFENEVWPRRVNDQQQPVWAGYQKFTKLQLFEFDTGKGGFITRQEEEENRILAELELELEIEALEKELEAEYGKDWWKK